MDKSVVVIPNENFTNIRLFSKKCNHHHESLTDFVFINDISISRSLLIHSYETSYQLAEEGNCILLYDNKETLKNIMIFLPLEISEKQYQFFKSKKEEFKEYNINILSQEQSGKFSLYDKTTHPKGIYECLLNILEQKLNIPNNNKIKKRIQNN